VQIEGFRAPAATLYTGPPVIGLVLVVISLATRFLGRSPFAGAALALLALVPLLGEVLLWRINLNAVLPLRVSQNVIARPDRSDGTDTRSRASNDATPVVLLAHYDTQRGSLLFHPGFRPYIQLFFTASYAGFFGVPVGLIATGWWPDSVLAATTLYAASGIALLASLMLVASNLMGSHINGANDNGSGTAVVLAAAERFAREPISGIEPVFLLTGAEEVGTRGMIDFMNRHGSELRRNTVFINVDNVGGGILHYLTREGMLIPVHYDAGLASLASQAAAESACEFRPKDNLLLPTDGLIAAHRGYRALTLIAFDEQGNIPHYHWHDDTLETVDMTVADQTGDVVWHMLRLLARS